MSSRSFLPWITTVGALALMLFIAWQAWEEFKPRKPQITPARKELVDQIMPQIVEDLRKAKKNIHSLVVFPLFGDNTEYVTDELRRQLDESGVFDVRDRSLDEKVRRKFGLRLKGVADVDPALAAGQSLGADAVLFGSVDALEVYPSGAKINLHLMLGTVADRVLAVDKRYTKEVVLDPLSPAAMQEKVSKVTLAQRFLAWVLVVLTLPIFSIGFIRSMVRKESNLSNAVALCVYTAVDGVLAALLLGFSFSSWMPTLLFCGAVAGAFAYNVFIMSFALKLET